MLGLLPDTEVARLYGMRRATVHAARVRAGIPRAERTPRTMGRQAQLLELMRATPMHAGDVARELGTTERQARRILAQMREDRLIGPSGLWSGSAILWRPRPNMPHHLDLLTPRTTP